MNERDLVRVLESSALVRTLESAGGWVRRAAGSSVLVPAAVRSWRLASSRIGVVLMIAVITHVALMFSARPTGWFWMVLPAAAAVIAAFLIYGHDQRHIRVE